MQKKIYCTKCGREIQPGLLYCDRCGQSVKKSIEKQTTQKDKQIEEIHQDRLNRKKVQRAKEIKKAVHRKKAAKANRIIAIVAALLIIALISAVAAYISVLKSSTLIDTSKEESAANTVEPTEQSNVNITTSETAEPKKTEATPEPAAAGSLKTYTDSVTGLACQYPSSFAEGIAQDGEKVRVTDIEGGAVITIGSESVSDTAPNLMLSYIDGLGAATSDISMNRAGNGWYAVTANTSTGITHRKLVIKDGNALYYDFTYDTSSLKAKEYEEYISQMDAGFNP